MWRWCRRGVLARSGERIRLKHVRAGGKILTSAAWVEAFIEELASADVQYFKLKDDTAAATPARDPAFAPPKRRQRRENAERSHRVAARAVAHHAQVASELDAEGL